MEGCKIDPITDHSRQPYTIISDYALIRGFRPNLNIAPAWSDHTTVLPSKVTKTRSSGKVTSGFATTDIGPLEYNTKLQILNVQGTGPELVEGKVVNDL